MTALEILSRDRDIVITGKVDGASMKPPMIDIMLDEWPGKVTIGQSVELVLKTGGRAR